MKAVFSVFELDTLLQDMVRKGTIIERAFEQPIAPQSFMDGLFRPASDFMVKPFDTFHATVSDYPETPLMHAYYPSDSWFKSK
jgi:hypothetical protein